MNKIISIKTEDCNIAEIIKGELTEYLSEHVNCIWHDRTWEVSAVVSESCARDLERMIRQCENYKEGKISYEIENEE